MKRAMSVGLRTFVVVVISATFVVGCTKVGVQTSTGTRAGNPWTVHGVLRWAGLSEPDTMNPVIGNAQIDTDLSMFWAGYLFNWNDQNQLVPELAAEVPTLQNGGISKDGLQITYHLRRGVKWQDGAPYSADDVLYTWRQVMNPVNNIASRVGYELITTIDKQDDYTIRVHLKKKFAPFVSSFLTMSSTSYPVLPRHLLAQYANINHAPYNNKPVGTGPFKVVKYEKGTLIKMVANPLYWRGPPKLREVTYRIIPDENTILTQLRTHEVDFEYNAPSSQAPSFKALTGIRVYLTPFTHYRQLALNAQSPILRDVTVRQALTYGTDRQELIDKVSHGVDTIGDTDQPAFLWAHNSKVKQYPYDAATANKLLDAAGWKLAGDGYRYKNGTKLQLTFTGATGAAETNNVELVLQQQWKKIGVQALVKNYQSGLFLATYGAGGILQTGKFDVGFYSWINGVDPDDSTLFMCNQFPPAGQNVYHFCDARLDAAENLALTNYDQARRKEAYDRIQSIIAEKAPLIIVWFVRRQDIANTDLKNYKPAHAVTTFWNTWEWSI